MTAPAALVLTLTVMPVVLVAPASRPLMLPAPLIRPAPVPELAPKLAFRSSTKPAAPVAMLVMLSTRDTDWPTCTVPKFSGAVLISPLAAWYTLPLTLICWLPTPMGANPLVPVPLET